MLSLVSTEISSSKRRLINDSRLKDLKKYENSLNTKGITFPMKLKDISKFEKLNPILFNVFSVNENKKFYPLRMAEKDCLNTIDLFFYEEDGVSHPVPNQTLF